MSSLSGNTAETSDSNPLLQQVKEKFETAKGIFTAQTVARLDTENNALRSEIENLRIQLGGDPNTLPVQNGSSSNVPPAPVTENVVPEEKKGKQPKSGGGGVKKAEGDSGKTAKLSKPANDDSPVDIGRLDLRVGRILEAKKHPDADSLYVESIDFGEASGPRTVVSGLVRFVPLEQMQNRLVVCLCNLKPAKMRGVESQAMVMCASTADKVEVLEISGDADSFKPGDPVLCSPYEHRPDAQLNPKKKIWEQVAPVLKVDSNGTAIYKEAPLLVNGKLEIRAPTLKDVPVK